MNAIKMEIMGKQSSLAGGSGARPREAGVEGLSR